MRLVRQPLALTLLTAVPLTVFQVTPPLLADLGVAALHSVVRLRGPDERTKRQVAERTVHRREQEPAVGDLQLFREIKALGYPDSMNLLVRYINQGRVEGDRPPMSPRRLTSLVLTSSDHLTDAQREHHHKLTTACPEMIDLTERDGSFAALLRPLREQRRTTRRLDHRRPNCRSAAPAHLRPRPRTRLRSRPRRRDHALPQRQSRRSQHQDQTNHATSARPSRVHPATPPDPPQLRSPTVTTERAPEPLPAQSRASGKRRFGGC